MLPGVEPTLGIVTLFGRLKLDSYLPLDLTVLVKEEEADPHFLENTLLYTDQDFDTEPENADENMAQPQTDRLRTNN